MDWFGVSPFCDLHIGLVINTTNELSHSK